MLKAWTPALRNASGRARFRPHTCWSSTSEPLVALEPGNPLGMCVNSSLQLWPEGQGQLHICSLSGSAQAWYHGTGCCLHAHMGQQQAASTQHTVPGCTEPEQLLSSPCLHCARRAAGVMAHVYQIAKPHWQSACTSLSPGLCRDVRRPSSWKEPQVTRTKVRASASAAQCTKACASSLPLLGLHRSVFCSPIHCLA